MTKIMKVLVKVTGIDVYVKLIHFITLERHTIVHKDNTKFRERKIRDGLETGSEKTIVDGRWGVREKEKRELKRPTHTTPGVVPAYSHTLRAGWRHRIVRRASIVVTIVRLRHYSKTIVRHNETDGRMSAERPIYFVQMCARLRVRARFTLLV